MKSLHLVAHGSRRAESNLEIARPGTRLADKAAADFHVVEPAFLELADPLWKLAR